MPGTRGMRRETSFPGLGIGLCPVLSAGPYCLLGHLVKRLHFAFRTARCCHGTRRGARERPAPDFGGGENSWCVCVFIFYFI